MDSTVYIHETAIVDSGAQIGAGTKIWHWTHVSAGAKLGEKCSLGQNVFLGNKVVLGSNVKVQNNVSIYDNVFIEDNVFCGPSMVFTNVINPRSGVVRKSEYKDTFVKKGVSIGANATIVCGITLGEYSFVAAGAVVTKDARPYALIAGVPGKQIGWMSQYGERIPLPMKGQGRWQCPSTGLIYVLNDEQISVEASAK
ncbi:acyltransferase [Bdellovibrio bacteriovorus]|uniref:acyltransferase n=1 Tax=Bdellovibrio bacteriovorus TaxID=959 RepID=UPI00190F1283|nr:acyltransferase [Bdellovibrio bacteriovorus]